MNDISRNPDIGTNDAERYKEKVESIVSKYKAALEDYKKYYVYYKLNPNIEENQTIFSQSESQLKLLSKSVIDLTKEVELKLEKVNNGMKEENEEIREKKKENDRLEHRLDGINNVYESSEIMIDDRKEIYNREYYNNWELFIGICALMGNIYMVGKNYVAPSIYA